MDVTMQKNSTDKTDEISECDRSIVTLLARLLLQDIISDVNEENQ